MRRFFSSEGAHTWYDTGGKRARRNPHKKTEKKGKRKKGGKSDVFGIKRRVKSQLKNTLCIGGKRDLGGGGGKLS